MRRLWMVTAGAALVRIAAALIAGPGASLYSDMAGYDRIAGQFVHHAFHPIDTLYAPGYPAMLAVLYLTIGRHFVAIGLIQALVGALTVFVTGIIAFRLSGSQRVAVIAGVIVAAYPPLIYYGTLLLTEAVAPCTLALTVWLLLRAAERPSVWRLTLSAAMFGLTVLIRSNLLLWLPGALTLLWLTGTWTKHTFARSAFAFVCVLVIVLAPAVLRNSIGLGHLAGPSTNGGVNFFMLQADVRGVSDQFGGFVPVRNALRYSTMYQSPEPRYEERYFYREGWVWFVRRTDKIPHALDNLAEGLGLGEQAYWPINTLPGQTTAGRVLRVFSVLFPCLVVGPLLAWPMWQVRRHGWRRLVSAEVVLAWSLIGVTVLCCVTFLADPRLHVPCDPLLLAALTAIGGKSAIGQSAR